MSNLTLAIFLLGIATVYLSILVAFKFAKYKSELCGGAYKLSNAISWQLVGEAIIGIGTLIFSAGAHYGWLKSWPIEFQSFLRFVMFFATSFTTFHLMKTLKRLDC